MNEAKTNIPRCRLLIDNIKMFSNSLTFEIFLSHLNPDDSYLEYAGGQFFLNFNPEIANGGNLIYTIEDSDLPLQFRPRNPSVKDSQLRLASNSAPGAGAGYNKIKTDEPGTMIVRMKLSTTANKFLDVPLNLSWRDTIPNPFTKILAYVQNVNTDITENIEFTIRTSKKIQKIKLHV